jgi:ParB family chromosome partitioning protein
LDVLIPAGETPQNGGLQEVALNQIEPNPHQPRKVSGEETLEELVASIKEHGIIQPLVVTQAQTGGYQLIAGERRWRAARLAGLTRVPVVVKEAAPQQMLELALVENVQRADLNPLEEALAYKQLAEEFDLSQSKIAQRVGKSRVAVTNTLRLLQAASEVQQALIEGQISEGHARALLGLPTHEAQVQALEFVLKRELNVRQTEALVQSMRKETEEEAAARSPKAGPSPEIKALEARFQESLGTRVQLKQGRKGGRVVIYFYSDEEFQALYERLTGEEL